MLGWLRKHLPGPLQRQLMYRFFYKSRRYSGEWELNELVNYVRSGSVAVDVGANAGVYTFFLSKIASRVYSFEANPKFAKALSLLGLGNVIVEEVALSNMSGDATLRIPRPGGQAEDHGMGSLESAAVSDDLLSQTINVPMRTLDSYKLANVGFIKIDVEGHEESVLNGAWRTVEVCRPHVLVEIEERHNLGGLTRIVKEFEERGFDGFFFLNKVKMPVSEFRLSEHQVVTRHIESRSRHRRDVVYINNFLFSPKPVP